MDWIDAHATLFMVIWFGLILAVVFLAEWAYREPPTCEDCRFSSYGRTGGLRCLAPQNDLVTDAKQQRADGFIAARANGRCGKSGRWFKPRELP